jgi:hypothetical protein
MDGSGNIWASTSAGGVKTIPFGTVGASTQLNTTAPTNTRVVNIFNGQLYVSSASGSFQGVGTVGTGTPITAGQTLTLLNGFPTASGPSNYDYVFASPSVLYVADDRTVASGGGLEKWTFDGTKWNLLYTLNSGLTNGLRGLAGSPDLIGNENLYATTADGTSKLVSIRDPISATTLPSTSFLTLALAPANTAFRGVEFVVPEANAFMFGLAACGVAALVYGGRALRRRQTTSA